MAVHTHPEAAFCSCKAFDIVAQDPHAMASSEQLKSSFAKQLSFAASHTEDCATHDHIPFDHTIVGFYSNHGCKPGRHPGTFKVKINQDHGEAWRARPLQPGVCTVLPFPLHAIMLAIQCSLSLTCVHVPQPL